MTEENNYLFLIAIDDYANLDKLNNCVQSVEEFKDVLLGRYLFSKENVYSIYNSEAKSKNIHDAFKTYIKRLKEKDNLIIYFSGHGHYDEHTERGYWAAYQSKKDDDSTFFSNADLIDFIKKIKAKHIVLISDSCFSRAILIDGEKKSVKSLSDYKSRWAITSGIGEVYDGSKGELNLFAETLITYLKNAQKDFLVSDLIHEIKHNFEINELQTPQGAPLKVPDHQAGEFLFKLRPEEERDEREFKGYGNLLKILQLYRSNVDFKEIMTFENKKEKIGYSLYQEFDSVEKKAKYYLYLYQGIRQKATYDYIKTKHEEIFLKNKVLIILLPKEKTLVNLDVRISNIEKLFKPTNTFFIDDFIREMCTPIFFRRKSEEQYLDINNFVISKDSKLA